MPSSPSKNNGSSKSKKKKPKFCHQCHQKTKDFRVWCKNEEGGTCSLVFCRQCLFKRYGEKAEEVALLDDWTCPRCRGICNCCVCRKKQDWKSTDVLIHGDKATGFSSDLEMLQVKGPERVSLEKDFQKTQVASDKGEESFVYECTDSKSNPKPTNSTSVFDDKKTEEGLEAIGDAKKNDDGGTCSSQSSPRSENVSKQVSEEKKNPKKRVSDIEVCLMKNQDFGVLNDSKNDDGGACSSQRGPKRPRKEMKSSGKCLIKPHIVPTHDETNTGFLASHSINPRICLLVFSIGICTLGLGRILG